MKKILLGIFTFAYFTLSVRANVYLHDCMDILADPLSKSHSEKEDKLPCKNDQGQCKLESKHRMNEAAFKFLRSTNDILTPVFADHEFKSAPPLWADYPVANYFPGTGRISLFLLHCVFRI